MEIKGSQSLPDNNTVIAPTDLKKVSCIFSGKNNKLIIGDKAKISNIEFSFPSDNGLIMVGNYSRVRGRIRASYNCKVIIGCNTTTTTFIQVFSAEQTNIIIGDDVMFAAGVIVRSEDGHAIYDVDTGNRVNLSNTVVIGAHVWIAEDVIILPGSRIAEGSVIGCRSIVTGPIPNNCVAVGTPARVVRNDIAWERPNVAFSEPFIKSNAIKQNLHSSPFWSKTSNDCGCINIGDKTSDFLQKHLLSFHCNDIKND